MTPYNVSGDPRPLLPPNFRTRIKQPVSERPQLGDANEMLIAAELRRRFLEGQAADSEFLRRAEFELDFLTNHWIEEETGKDIGRALLGSGRSAFDIDLLTPSMDIIINQIRINKSTINFLPESGAANKATAEVRQGLYRDIERRSKAFIARETGYQFAVSVGRGYWRVIIEDEDGASFLQRVGIQRVDNLHCVVMDPNCLDFTYGDANWAWVWESMERQQFIAQYGLEPQFPLDASGLTLPEGDRAIWFPSDRVIVGEYFRRTWKKRTVVELVDKTACWSDEVPYGAQTTGRTKTKLDFTIEWRKMTGTQTLEKRIWPGRYIPIVVCIGREIFRGKKPKIHSGMIRPAINPSRIHDAMFSRMVDEVGFGPLPHMFAAVGHLTPEQERIVNNINQHPWAVVTYTPQEDAAGRQIPPPHWESPGVNTVAVVQAAQLSAEKLDRVLSIYAPQRGQPVGEMSGRAMREVKDQGDASHAAFPDNYNRALFQEAVIINDLMDNVYTDEQAITITEPDDTTKQVLINQWFQDKKTGKNTIHLFGPDGGRYGVAPVIGKSYPNRMAQAGEQLLDLAKAFPQQVANALDLIVADLGIPNSQKYAERLRPAGIANEEDGPTYAELQQHVQEQEQNAQQADALIQKLLDRVQELGSAEALKRMEIASRERIAAAGDRTQIVLAEIKAGQEAEHSVLMARIEAILRQMETAEEGVSAEAAQPAA